MHKPSPRHALVAGIIVALAGCSSPPKKGPAPEADPLTASAEKFRKDAGQTEADLADLEAQVKRTK